MKTDNFFGFEIVDKFSRLFMLIFAGILLGAVLALAYYNIFSPKIGATLTLIAFYCIIFVTYICCTNSKRHVAKLEIYKDKLALVFTKGDKISTRKEAAFNEIKEYKISALTDKKNAVLENPDINKFSLRVFGFKTLIETHAGEKIEFQDNYSTDGVLIYSPGYVYRMLDVKRFIPDFPLKLENFNSKKDVEDFCAQFEYYKENEKNLPLIKNKAYLWALVKYTLACIVIAALIACAIAYVIYADLKNGSCALLFLWTALVIVIGIIAPMWIVSFLNDITGSMANKFFREKIKSIIKGA